MGPFSQLTVGFRNSNRPKNSYFATMLVCKSHVQTINDALDDLNIAELENLALQCKEIEPLMIGLGISPKQAEIVLGAKLAMLGICAETESLRMQALMLSSELMTTVTIKGVNYAELMGTDDTSLEHVIKVFQRTEAEAEKAQIVQSLAPGSGAETTYGEKLAAAINKTN